jgi:hypothetical protein
VKLNPAKLLKSNMATAQCLPRREILKDPISTERIKAISQRLRGASKCRVSFGRHDTAQSLLLAAPSKLRVDELFDLYCWCRSLSLRSWSSVALPDLRPFQLWRFEPNPFEESARARTGTGLRGRLSKGVDVESLNNLFRSITHPPQSEYRPQAAVAENHFIKSKPRK